LSGDEYIRGILRKYAVNTYAAETAANAVAPSIRVWAGTQLASLSFSGSFAKGTANNIGTDIDLFISLKSDTRETLSQIYESLVARAYSLGWNPRRQNVSVGISYAGSKMDLVPARIQSGYQNVHSLYKSKTDSWTQTNIKTHIDKVSASGRIEEIRAIKIWRDLHGLSFPSFYLELFIIQALAGKTRGNVAINVLAALSSIGNSLANTRIVDPANTNNVISSDLSGTEKVSVANQARISANKPYWRDILW
jgi:hypothetical protein